VCVCVWGSVIEGAGEREREVFVCVCERESVCSYEIQWGCVFVRMGR